MALTKSQRLHVQSFARFDGIRSLAPHFRVTFYATTGWSVRHTSTKNRSVQANAAVVTPARGRLDDLLYSALAGGYKPCHLWPLGLSCRTTINTYFQCLHGWPTQKRASKVAAGIVFLASSIYFYKHWIERMCPDLRSQGGESALLGSHLITAGTGTMLRSASHLGASA